MKLRNILAVLSFLLLFSLLFSGCANEKESNGNDLIKHIVLDGDELQVKDDGTHYVTLTADADGVWRYQIKYHTYPEHTTASDVDFVLVSANPYAAIDTKTATVTLTKAGVATVLLKGKGQSEASIALEIWAK